MSEFSAKYPSMMSDIKKTTKLFPRHADNKILVATWKANGCNLIVYINQNEVMYYSRNGKIADPKDPKLMFQKRELLAMDGKNRDNFIELAKFMECKKMWVYGELIPVIPGYSYGLNRDNADIYIFDIIKDDISHGFIPFGEIIEILQKFDKFARYATPITNELYSLRDLQECGRQIVDELSLKYPGLVDEGCVFRPLNDELRTKTDYVDQRLMVKIKTTKYQEKNKKLWTPKIKRRGNPQYYKPMMKKINSERFESVKSHGFDPDNDDEFRKAVYEDIFEEMFRTSRKKDAEKNDIKRQLKADHRVKEKIEDEFKLFKQKLFDEDDKEYSVIFKK